MAECLVQDLGRAGVSARRLPANEPRPASGWRVRGAFTEAQAGNRFERVVAGLGAGAASVEMHVGLCDLVRAHAHLFFEFDTSASTGERPGAAFSVNPIRIPLKAARRWVGLEKQIKRTAKRITKEILAQVRSLDPPGK